MAEWIAPARLASLLDAPRRIASSGPWQHFAAWRGRVEGWRAAFARRPGRWALYLDDASDCAAALIGAWLSGSEPWLCPDPLPGTLAAMAAQVEGFAGALPSVPAPLWPDPEPASGTVPKTVVVLNELDETRSRLVVFTSGSSGAPLAIGKTLAQLTREIEALEQCFGRDIAAADRVLAMVSHQHIYGLLFGLLWPLAAGRMLSPRLFFHEALLAALQRQETAALLVASPAHLKRIPEGLDWAAVRNRLQAVFCSGAPLPGAAALQARACLGPAVTEIFGSSESGGIAWRRRETEPPPPWQALPGVQWRIGEGGRLEIRSPHLPERQWWMSQDRVEAAAAGFNVLGRADRIVKIEARRVSLDALEQALRAQDEVEEVRVLSLPGEQRQRLAAVLVPSARGAALLRTLGRRGFARRLSEALAAQHDAVTRPRLWRFVMALPLNAQGKTCQAALQALFEPGGILPFPHLLRREATRAELELELEAGLEVFDGHFPQRPVLPGVAQLHWAIGYARQLFALPPQWRGMEALKFQRILRPGQTVRLALEWRAGDGVLRFVWSHADGGHASSGRVLWGRPACPA